MKCNTLTITSMLLGVTCYAQQVEEVFVNKGEMSVNPSTLVSAHFRFENTVGANAQNNGNFHFFADYKNDGTFSFNTAKLSGAKPFVHFVGGNETHQTPNIQDIQGTSTSEFYNVVFQKEGLRDKAMGSKRSFIMTNPVTITGASYMENGIVQMKKDQGGSITYLQGAIHDGTSDESHIHGEVIKIGDEEFTYPIGKGNFFRPASISSPVNASDTYLGEYFLENSNAISPHNKKEASIGYINNREYWNITQTPTTQGTVLVTLSWDERTTPYEIYRNNAQGAYIVRWDTQKQMWVNEGGIVDVTNKTITTALEAKGFGIFTMARAETNPQTPDTDLEIFNGVSDNDDNKNDYFVISGAENFKNKLQIFNRWGVKVYETDNYGHSPEAFFSGVSDGRVTIERNRRLPTGTYFYIFEYYNAANEFKIHQGWLFLKND